MIQVQFQSSKFVMKFIAELQILSEFCEFGVMLDDMIRDHLIGMSYK